MRLVATTQLSALMLKSLILFYRPASREVTSRQRRHQAFSPAKIGWRILLVSLHSLRLPYLAYPHQRAAFFSHGCDRPDHWNRLRDRSDSTAEPRGRPPPKPAEMRSGTDAFRRSRGFALCGRSSI